MRAANRDLMRAINRDIVLRTIRVQGDISRKRIAAQTGLSQSTVTDISAELLKDGVIVEKAQKKGGSGRPQVLLALNPDGVFVAGAYIAAGRVSVVVINLEARVMGAHSMPVGPNVSSPDDIADLLAEAVQTCCVRHGFIPEDISGLGLGIPGLVNSEAGVVYYHPSFNKGFDWANVPFKELVEKRTGFQTFIENSSNTLAIFEHWFGAARGVDNFFVLTLEHGVGLGLYVNGVLARGWQGIAGELGHVRGESKESECRCGMKGCLEAEASPHAILQQAREAARSGRWKSPIPDDIEGITLEQVIQAAERGDAVLQDIFTRAGGILGRRVADLARVLDPQTIIITGKSSLAQDMLFAPLSQAMAACTSEIFEQPPGLVVRPWREDNYARGAGVLVLQKLHQSCAVFPLG